jgi:hypothetical protein
MGEQVMHLTNLRRSGIAQVDEAIIFAGYRNVLHIGTYWRRRKNRFFIARAFSVDWTRKTKCDDNWTRAASIGRVHFPALDVVDCSTLEHERPRYWLDLGDAAIPSEGYDCNDYTLNMSGLGDRRIR